MVGVVRDFNLLLKEDSLLAVSWSRKVVLCTCLPSAGVDDDDPALLCTSETGLPGFLNTLSEYWLVVELEMFLG